MANVKGRGVTVAISASYSTPIAVTAVTQASPGVATSVAHGLNDNDVGYFSDVVGMSQLDYQACRVKNKTADSFELQGLATTGYAIRDETRRAGRWPALDRALAASPCSAATDWRGGCPAPSPQTPPALPRRLRP